ncbi:Ferritin Dps family protein [Pseudomonas putida LS46]|nr:Ferritin Dps family protein [Pseudomonas putida LS46]
MRNRCGSGHAREHRRSRCPTIHRQPPARCSALHLGRRAPLPRGLSNLHLMFEEQYNELALAVDSIAERIRALGFPAPGSYAFYARHSSIKEEEGVPPADEMIRQLVQGQEAVVRTARSIFPVVDKVSDEPTADLLTQRMQVHEKTAWMLRVLLDGK